jgi:hypothetical protein
MDITDIIPRIPTAAGSAKTVTPKSIAAVTKAPSAAAKPKGISTPASSTPRVTAPKPTTSARSTASSGTGTQKFLADMLYADPSKQFAPALDYLTQQEQAAKDRYGKNKASLESILGTLSDLSAKDSARINEQFTQSITQQQQALAARTAEARAGSAAGVAQAAATGAERGAGPGMAVNPIQVATEEGIGQSNAYQQTWEGLMKANQMQAVQDTATRQTGFGFQQAQAVADLQKSLEDRLLTLSGNKAQVQSDIAQAKYSAQQQVREAKYGEAMAAAERSRQAAAAAAAAKDTFAPGIQGIQQKAQKSGVDFNGLQAGLSEAYDAAFAKLNPDGGATRAVQKPSKAEVMAAWTQFNAGNSSAISLANDLAGLLYTTR